MHKKILPSTFSIPTFPSFTKQNNYLIFVGIIAIIALVFAILAYTNEDFANNVFGSSNLKDLDVIMFMSPTCPWCQKSLEMLKKNNKLDDLIIIDVTTEDGKKEALKYGATKGLPTFVSRKTNLGTVGSQESIKKLVKDLTVNESFTNSGNVGVGNNENVQIMLFYRENCKWCNKAKEDIKNMNLNVEMKDLNSKEGKEIAKQFGIKGDSSVPVFVNKVTKKKVVGYKQLNDIFNELKQ